MLDKILKDYGIDAVIKSHKKGPVIERYFIKLNKGEKLSRLQAVSADIARNLAVNNIYISQQKDSSLITIEIPRKDRQIIYTKDLLNTLDKEYEIPLLLGTDISGKPVYKDLVEMPHLLIAGATGSGKSVCLNSIIYSLIYHKEKMIQFLMIDPKQLELTPYNKLGDLLLCPVITEPLDAIEKLKGVIKIMEERYSLLRNEGVRNIKSYNDKMTSNEKPLMRYIVVVIDELSDLMMTAGKDIEKVIKRLTQLGRAAGIHLIVATQRPSVDVITGVIKANLPTRIAFTVASQIDSRTIIDQKGAEQLVGKGDMFFYNGGIKLERLHSGFLEDAEIEQLLTLYNKNKSVGKLKTFTQWLNKCRDNYKKQTIIINMCFNIVLIIIIKIITYFLLIANVFLFIFCCALKIFNFIVGLVAPFFMILYYIGGGKPKRRLF